MTDNEIIKALESCISVGCKTCPLYTDATGTCIKRTMLNAHDLINRQKAQIKELKNEIEEANIIERENEIQSAEENKENAKIFLQAIKYAKSEAIKEFAEKLKENMRLEDDCEYDCEQCCYECREWVPIVDNLIKEMTEADK